VGIGVGVDGFVFGGGARVGVELFVGGAALGIAFGAANENRNERR
jgi:hypothetical protein